MYLMSLIGRHSTLVVPWRSDVGIGFDDVIVFLNPYLGRVLYVANDLEIHAEVMNDNLHTIRHKTFKIITNAFKLSRMRKPWRQALSHVCDAKLDDKDVAGFQFEYLHLSSSLFCRMISKRNV